jgi:hypothetical protein
MAVLIGRDILYPELARYLAVQGVDLIAGIAAAPGQAQASVARSALGLRAEENQVYAAASFLLGPNFLDRENREDYYGQSALLAPISLSAKGDGVLSTTASNRTEAVTGADLDAGALDNLRRTSRFRPRQEMNLGSAGPVLAEMYRGELNIEEAVERRIGWAVEPTPAAPLFEPDFPAEPLPPESEVLFVPEPEPASVVVRVPESESEPAAEAAIEADAEAGAEAELESDVDMVDAGAELEAEPEADEEILSNSAPDAPSLSGRARQQDDEE